jgi:hypothetical protein
LELPLSFEATEPNLLQVVPPRQRGGTSAGGLKGHCSWRSLGPQGQDCGPCVYGQKSATPFDQENKMACQSHHSRRHEERLHGRAPPVSARLLPLFLGLALLPGAVLAESPYAGYEGRPIKALSAQEIDDLLEGRGMGFAKAAELNSYPGPAHVLDLAPALAMTPGQQAAVEESRARMSVEAKRLGAELVAEEEALDRAFAHGHITPEELARRTALIGELQGLLRAVHLRAHLEMRKILTAGQIAQYDRLRGYGGTAVHQHGKHGG